MTQTTWEVIAENGTQCWYKDGKLHREDGPAIIGADGSQAWYLNGEELTEKEFLEKKKRPIDWRRYRIKPGDGVFQNSCIWTIWDVYENVPVVNLNGASSLMQATILCKALEAELLLPEYKRTRTFDESLIQRI